MISLVELAVRVGGLKVNVCSDEFRASFRREHRQRVGPVRYGQWNGLHGHLRAARVATACALSMMQRLSSEMRGGQRSLKSTGSRSFELWFRRHRAAFRPVRSRLPVGIAPTSRFILTACVTQV